MVHLPIPIVYLCDGRHYLPIPIFLICVVDGIIEGLPFTYQLATSENASSLSLWPNLICPPALCVQSVYVYGSQGGPVMTVEEELEMKKLKARVHVLFEDNWRNGTC